MRITQKHCIFYLLYKNIENEYIPAWKFTGEVHISELNKFGFMSYKTPTQLSDVYFDNPGLIERKWIKGKSGAKFYGYRFKERNTNLIKDKKMKEFVENIKK